MSDAMTGERTWRFAASSTAFEQDGVFIDLELRLAWRNSSRIKLSPTEWMIVAALIRAGRRPVSHAELARAIWGVPADADCRRRLRVHMTHIRQKLEREPGRPRVFGTEPGYGYRIVV